MRRIAISLSFLYASSFLFAQPYPPGKLAVDWKLDTHLQHGLGSDLWPLTWAADGNIYAAWGDGWGWNKKGPKHSIGVTRISGMPPKLAGEDLWGEGPGAGFGKPEALIGIDGQIYMFWTNGRSKDDRANTATAISSDRGVTWRLNPAKAFPEFPDGFRVRGIAHFGPGYAGAMDDFVYVYFGFSRANEIFLARAPKRRIFEPGAYEWFGGMAADRPVWKRRFADRKPVFSDPNGYWWHVGVTFVPGLKRFLLTKPHFAAGANRELPGGDRSKLTGLGIFDAPAPWGPWTTAYYADRFRDGLFKFTYFIPGKYVARDGKSFWLAWSGYPEYDNVNFVRGEVRYR